MDWSQIFINKFAQNAMIPAGIITILCFVFGLLTYIHRGETARPNDREWVMLTRRLHLLIRSSLTIMAIVLVAKSVPAGDPSKGGELIVIKTVWGNFQEAYDACAKGIDGVDPVTKDRLCSQRAMALTRPDVKVFTQAVFHSNQKAYEATYNNCVAKGGTNPDKCHEMAMDVIKSN